MIARCSSQDRFSLILLLIFVALICLTFSYDLSIQQIIIPLAVLFLGAVSCLLKLAIRGTGWQKVLDEVSSLKNDEKKERENNRLELKLLLWIIFMTASLYLIGFAITVFVFSYIYTAIITRRSKIHGVLLSLGTTITLLIMSYALKVPLGGGIIFGG